MMLVDAPARDGVTGSQVAVFGVGLIGSSVVSAVCSRAGVTPAALPLHWQDPSQTDADLIHIENTIGSRLTTGTQLSILWSAGRAGFMSAQEETDSELAVFRKVLGMAERLAVSRSPARTSFHMVSSAGGLFEGQRHVTDRSVPDPRRPYGRLKLAQEELLLSSRVLSARSIYRVSSAYGYLGRGVRPGLVSTLLYDGFTRRVTHITGRMSTLRDYVFTADVAFYISGKLLDPRDREEVSLLACNRPCSLLEVQHIVEDVMRRKLHVAYSVAAANSEDITFDPAAAPAGWRSTDLRANAGMIYREALNTGMWSSLGSSPGRSGN